MNTWIARFNQDSTLVAPPACVAPGVDPAIAAPAMGWTGWRVITDAEVAALRQQADEAAFNALTSAEKRNHAYRTLPLIPDGTEALTVDQANAKWLQYFVEQNEKADALQVAIVEAKAHIRALYPSRLPPRSARQPAACPGVRPSGSGRENPATNRRSVAPRS